MSTRRKVLAIVVVGLLLVSNWMVWRFIRSMNEGGGKAGAPKGVEGSETRQ